ncbi:MAG TPA: hypothetical protein VGG58_01920 [Candidatus Acidoferrum sp.]
MARRCKEPARMLFASQRAALSKPALPVRAECFVVMLTSILFGGLDGLFIVRYS